MRTAAGGPMLALIVLILIFFLRAGRFSQHHASSNTQNPVDSSAKSAETSSANGSSSSADPGPDARIASQKDIVPVGTTAEDYDVYTQIMGSKNKDGFQSMIENGQIFLVPSGTKCRVINPGRPDDEVRIEQGNFYGHHGFVPAEFVKAN